MKIFLSVLLAVVLMIGLVGCGAEDAEFSIEESTSLEEAISMEESSKQESLEVASNDVSLTSTVATDERMNSRVFYDALVPKATSMGYKCEWVGEVSYSYGIKTQIGEFTLPSGYRIRVSYGDTE
jgi:hypothetical protein